MGVFYSVPSGPNFGNGCDCPNYVALFMPCAPSGVQHDICNNPGQLASETAPWSSDTVSFAYNQGHRTNLSLTQPSGSWSQAYAYDAEWRMTNITSPAGAFAYTYTTPNPASALISGIALPNGASITNVYDTLGRLTGTALANQFGHVLDGYVYGLDLLGLRTNITRELGLTTNSVTIGYDGIDEVTSWSAKEANGTPRQNEQLGYGYDAANNLHLRTNNALVQVFTVDSLNQLSNVVRSGTLTVTGATPVPATNVSVNGITAQTNGDFTFAASGNTLSNGANTFTVVAQNIYGVKATNMLSLNLPTNVTLQYDGNGNLTNDGTRVFSYDAENQLTNVLATNAWRVGFIYDGLNRRRIQLDYTWQSNAWLPTNGVLYIYDGNLVLQERDANNNTLVTYTRGLDLSLSRHGAGGIGGLLARTDTNGSTFYHSDGNGNITALLDASQNIVARYRYDAFGRLIGRWGTNANRIMFSSMEYFSSPNLYGYPGRFYDPVLQRWPNRDPVFEEGFKALTGWNSIRRTDINVYEFVLNAPTRRVDSYGLFSLISDWIKKCWSIHKCLDGVQAWYKDCIKNMPNCDDPSLDAFKYAECLEKRQHVIKDCTDKAAPMIKKCQEATNPADPPDDPVPPDNPVPPSKP